MMKPDMENRRIEFTAERQGKEVFGCMALKNIHFEWEITGDPDMKEMFKIIQEEVENLLAASALNQLDRVGSQIESLFEQMGDDDD